MRPLYTCKRPSLQSIIQALILIQQNIMQKQTPFLDKLIHERQIRILHVELTEMTMQIQDREAKIAQLERVIAKSRDEKIEESIVIEEETQCSIQDFSSFERDELIRRLSSMLTQREEQGVRLHLATLQKEGKMSQLMVKLQEYEELLTTQQSQVYTLEGKIIQNEMAVDGIKTENDELRLQNLKLRGIIEEKQSEINAYKANQQNLRVLQENKVILQHIMIQNQNKRKEQGREQSIQSKLMQELLEKQLTEMTEQVQKMKKIVNNYDWKLFCLETELDLSNKEKKQYKYVNDKNQTKINEYQTQIKHLNIKIYEHEDDIKLLSDENKYLELEVEHKQGRIEQLLAEIDELQEAQQLEDIKELNYRIQEKDEELKEITNYLKEKINENHELKVKLSKIEKLLQETQKKTEKIEFQNYQLEQSIIQNEQIIQKQSDKIDQFANQSEFLNKKINDLSLMNILRVQQFEEQYASMQNLIKEKSQKINELSVEIIEREIQFNKKLEEANQQLEQLQSFKDQVNLLSEDQALANNEISHLKFLNSTKDKEIDKIVNKMSSLEVNIKEKEKIMQFLQNQLKSIRSQLKEEKQITQRQAEELEDVKEIIAVNDEKLKILKREAVDNIQSELKYEFEIESLKKKLSKLEVQKQDLLLTTMKQETKMEAMKKEVTELHVISKIRIQQIIDQLSAPISHEETSTFEILDQDDFEVMSIETERDDIRKKMLKYNDELEAICSKYEEE